MSVDTTLTLPPTRRLRDVGTVLGLAVGLPLVRYPLGDGSESVDAAGVTIKGFEDMPECANIFLDAPEGSVMVDGETAHRAFFHFEGQGGKRMVRAISSPFWVAAFLRVASVMGGTVDVSDCDNIEVDYKSSGRPSVSWDAEDGAPWTRLQKAMASTVPLHAGELIIVDRQFNIG